MRHILLFRLIGLFILLSFSCGDSPAANRGDVASVLDSLDMTLQHRSQFDRQKNERIARLRVQLSRTAQPARRYRLLTALFGEYGSYRYDSAYHYASRAIALADQTGNPDYAAEARCNRAFCFLSAGLFHEALEGLESVDISNVSDTTRILYYNLCTRLYYAMSDYAQSEPFFSHYVKQGNRCQETAKRLLTPYSTMWYYVVGQRQMKDAEYGNSIASFETLLRRPDVTTHDRAIVESSIGWMWTVRGDELRAVVHLARAAMADCEASVKETTALCTLAELLYKQGDYKRATRYVELSLEDANFYGARLRKIETGRVLPIIEQKNYEILASRQHWLILGIVMALLLVAALAAATVIFIRQKRSLIEARKEIGQRNLQLENIVTQLNEANKIKDEYIGNSFYSNSEQINHLEKLYKTIGRRLAARQYDNVSEMLSESSLKEERDNMYAAFDATFLKIFPHFVESYNALFPPQEQKHPGEERLTTEMRIYALIRLGISQSERIAKFLNYSVNTINTYKTRIKNRSLVDNDLFEKKIMEIGS